MWGYMEVVCLILSLTLVSLPTIFAYFLGFDVPTFYSKCNLLFLYTYVHVGLLCGNGAANVPFSSLASLYNAYRALEFKFLKWNDFGIFHFLNWKLMLLNE